MFRLMFAVALAMWTPTVVTMVPAKRRPGKKLMLVVDVSGSMVGTPLEDALGVVRMVGGQPIDEAELAVVAFADCWTRWKYKKKTWAKLPDAKAVSDAVRWLRSEGPGGGTQLSPALKHALQEPRKGLTIVVVSDGQFVWPDKVLPTFRKWQAWRVKKGYGKALVMCYGIGGSKAAPLSSKSLVWKAVMWRLAVAGEGGLYTTQKEKRK